MENGEKTKKQLTQELRKLREQMKKYEPALARSREAGKALRRHNRQLSKDIAELRETQRRTIQRERLHALGQMASGIVHDFNNALTPILGASDFLLTNPKILENKKETILLLESTRTAARDAKNMVRRLRDFYRPEEDAEVGLVDINSMIEQAVLLTQPKWEKQAQAMGVTIKVKTNLRKVPCMLANESHLREVLTNIIFNAVDAMPDGGTITIRSRLDQKKRLVLEVIDTGKGMSEEVRHRCFEPFFSTKGKNGTGMGLAIVYGVVRRYNGTIDIESEEGKGTTVRISLPVCESPRESTGEVVSSESKPVAPLHVLVIDDDLLARGIIIRYLNADGHTVEAVTSAPGALKKCRKGLFDLMLLGKIMPKVGGQRLPALVKKKVPDIPVILLTGHGDVTMEKELIDGVDMVLGKPVTQLELREAIVKLMANRDAEARGVNPS